MVPTWLVTRFDRRLVWSTLQVLGASGQANWIEDLEPLGRPQTTDVVVPVTWGGWDRDAPPRGEKTPRVGGFSDFSL